MTGAAACRSRRSRGGCCSPLRFGSLNILLSRDLTDRTRILYHRSVRERAERALPFLLFDRDPYIVIAADGRLKWMLDGYTTTDRYPYSQPVTDGRELHAQQREGRRSTRTTATSARTSRRPTTRSSARCRASIRGCSSRSTRCRPTCGRTCAIPRICSGCRRRCTRRTTWPTRRRSTTARISGRCRAPRR